MLESATTTQPFVQLLELGAHFALAERAAKIGYWRHNLLDGTLHWSPGFYAMLGLDPAQVPARSEFLMDRIHPDDHANVAAALGAAAREGKAFQYRTRSWDFGAERVFDTYGDVQRDDKGHVTAILGVVREVTAEVSAEKHLKEREAAYRFVAEEATDVIVRYGRDGVPMFVSPAVLQVLGCTAQAFLSEHPMDRCHPDEIDVVKRALSAAETGETVTYAYRARHTLGHYVWIETRLRFVFDEHGPAGAISISRDITERKAFEEALQTSRERAEYASHTKSRFLANMSHELRTPLNAIMGFSDIISREMFGPLGNERYGEYAQMINESGALLLDLINDLLDMSKIEAGKLELHIEEFPVGDIIDATKKLLSVRAESRRIEIKTDVTPPNLLLAADSRAFKQILLNLLSNAVKFTEPGGRIDIIAAADGDTMRLTVRDTGIGIPTDVLPRLARPFEQASNDPTRAHGGSGLGLALVKSLTQMHGGEFSIESALGRGTTVTVTMPLSGAAARAA